MDFYVVDLIESEEEPDPNIRDYESSCGTAIDAVYVVPYTEGDNYLHISYTTPDIEDSYVELDTCESAIPAGWFPYEDDEYENIEYVYREDEDPNGEICEYGRTIPLVVNNTYIWKK